MKDVYCHCTECSNPIEILSLDNNIIKFKCANEKEQHEKEIPLKDFINNMKENQKHDIDNSCQIHSKEYNIFVQIVIKIFAKYVYNQENTIIMSKMIQKMKYHLKKMR